MFSDTVQKNFKLTVWVIILLIFQTVICRYIAVGGIIPDVVFVFAISFVVLEKKYSYCLAVALICGFFADILGGRGFGVNILSYTYSALLCYAVGEHFFKEKLVFAVPMVFCMTFLCELMFFVFNIKMFAASGFWHITKTVILPSALYNTVITIAVYPLAKRTLYKSDNYVKIPNSRRR